MKPAMNWSSLRAALLAILLAALLGACKNKADSVPLPESTDSVTSIATDSELEVRLGAPAESIFAGSTPTSKTTREKDRTVILGPKRICVSGKKNERICVDAALVFVNHPAGVIDGVNISFPIKTVTFDEAVASTRALLESVSGIEQSEIDNMIGKWEAGGAPESVFDNKSGRIVSLDGLRLYCELKYHDPGLYFCTVQISR